MENITPDQLQDIINVILSNIPGMVRTQPDEWSLPNDTSFWLDPEFAPKYAIDHATELVVYFAWRQGRKQALVGVTIAIQNGTIQ